LLLFFKKEGLCFAIIHGADNGAAEPIACLPDVVLKHQGPPPETLRTP
jgi:hypothetical protein